MHHAEKPQGELLFQGWGVPAGSGVIYSIDLYLIRAERPQLRRLS